MIATVDKRTVIANQSPYRSDTTQRIDEKGLDPFGHRDYADAIEAALAEVPSQFTLGLFGPWGSGKSTILEELSRRLNDGAGQTALAVFDAWRYDGDSLRREFIRAVAQQLKDHEVLPKRFKVKKHMEAFELDVTRPREAGPRPTLASVFSAALSALIVLAVIGALYGLVAIFDPNDKTTVKGAIAVLGPLVAFILVVAGRLVSPVQIQEARRRFEFPEQFTQNFRELLDKVEVDRVVIAIDNLDRCSPKRVAEVLTTIKTFLEPALAAGKTPSAKSLCFIIAADDEALRRHLIAQELAASAPTSLERLSASRKESRRSTKGTVTDEDSASALPDPTEVARKSVDEYLRKFFNGSIRIAEMLDEDMREFSRRQLKDFIASHEEIDEETADKMVELTAHGLMRNPRRIKQFINNLELRLQLFSDRHAAGHIQIPADALVVAKLAILEEDFPDEHEALRRQPGLLERWHERAEQGESGDLNRDLVDFLRFTNNIRSPHIATYLTMKQTRDELELPGYSEFIAMLDAARTAELDQRLGAMSEEEVERHVAAARAHFDREVDARAWSSAHGTARSVVEIPKLRGAGALVEHVMDRSLAHRELKVRLIDLEPQLLLDVALQSLNASRRADLVKAMMAEAEGKDAAPQRRRQICDAFARNAEQLDTEAKGRLKHAFRDQALRQDFSAYADLAEKVPEIVNEEAISEAVTSLSDAEGFEAGDPRLKVTLASPGLLSANSELADSVLEASREALDVYRRQAGGLPPVSTTPESWSRKTPARRSRCHPRSRPTRPSSGVKQSSSPGSPRSRSASSPRTWGSHTRRCAAG